MLRRNISLELLPRQEMPTARSRWVFCPWSIILLLLLRTLAPIPSVSAAATSGNIKKNDNGQKKTNSNNKRLVLFAGPHYCASTSVEKFFYEYARGNVSGKQDKKAFPFRYWKWPRVNTSVVESLAEDEEFQKQPFKVFQQLVTKSGDGPVQEALLGSIQEAWDSVTAGVIVGTEAFDMGTDGLSAMQRVIKRLKIQSMNDVTVVINYRTPRFAQWQSIWSHARSGPTGDATTTTAFTGDTSYQAWLCNENDYAHKVGLLHAQMNPLKLAKSILQQYKWQVALMDMEGIEEADLDVSHVIACQIMHVACTKDETWVKQHVHQAMHENDSVYDDESGELASNATGLSEQDQELAEDLFRFRDCGLKDEILSLMNASYRPEAPSSPPSDDFSSIGLTVYHSSSLWHGCHPEMAHVYEQVQNPDFMFQALLSQTECAAPTVTIEDLLSGTYEAINETKGKETWHQVILELALYPLILIAALAFQICRMYRGGLGARRYQKIANFEEEREAEMTELTSSSRNGETDLDAEYGDIGEEEDDEDEFLDALQSQSSQEIETQPK